MKNIDTYDRWILEGYKYFSETGPVEFSIKELSEKAGLSRTSFHYYFESKEDFFDQLIEHHMEEVRRFGKLAMENSNEVMRSVARAMEKMHVGMMFHTQLFTHRKISRFNRAYLEGHEINYNNGLLDWILDLLELKMTKEEGKRAYLLFVDVLNSRLSFLIQTNGTSASFSSIFLEVIEDFKLMLRSHLPEEK